MSDRLSLYERATRPGGWTTYTPSIINLTQGNGTYSDTEYSLVGAGKEMRLRGAFTFGSTSVMGTGPYTRLPTGYTLRGSLARTYQAGVCRTAGGSDWTNFVGANPANGRLTFYVLTTSGTRYGVLNSTTPFTWGTGDILMWDITVALA